MPSMNSLFCENEGSRHSNAFKEKFACDIIISICMTMVQLCTSESCSCVCNWFKGDKGVGNGNGNQCGTSLTRQQSSEIEYIQKMTMKSILQDKHVNYQLAC